MVRYQRAAQDFTLKITGGGKGLRPKSSAAATTEVNELTKQERKFIFNIHTQALIDFLVICSMNDEYRAAMLKAQDYKPRSTTEQLDEISRVAKLPEEKRYPVEEQRACHELLREEDATRIYTGVNLFLNRYSIIKLRSTLIQLASSNPELRRELSKQIAEFLKSRADVRKYLAKLP